MRPKPLTNNAIYALLGRLLGPLLDKHKLGLLQATVGAHGTFADSVCGRPPLRGADTVFYFTDTDCSTGLVLVRASGALHLPKWLGKAAGRDTAYRDGRLPYEEDIVDLLTPLLPQIEEKMLLIGEDRERTLRASKLMVEVAAVANIHAPDNGRAARGSGDGGDFVVTAKTPGTVNLRIELNHIPGEEAKAILRLLGPTIGAICELP